MKKNIFLFVVLSAACSTQEVKKPFVIDLLSRPAHEISYLSEIASDIEYIPLQTSEYSIISYIHDIKTDSTNFYIYPNNKILCFDRQGKFLYKLDNEGRGPEEYTYILDWDISSDNKLLLVLLNRKLLIFENTGSNFSYLKTLNFQNSSSIPEKAAFIPKQRMILLTNFSSAGNDSFRNVFINLDGDTLDFRPNYYGYTQTQRIGFSLAYSNIDYKFDNSIYFKEIFSDTIFTYNPNNKIHPYMILDSHDKHPSPESFANISFDLFVVPANIQKIFEVKRFIIYRYIYQKVPSFGIYDKLTRSKFGMNTESFLIDDLQGGINFEPKFCSEEKLYSWIDAYTLKNYISSEKFIKSKVKNPEKKKLLKSMADSLNETDNPVLIVVTPKK